MEDPDKCSGVAKTVEKAVNLFFTANEVDFNMGSHAVTLETEEIPNISKPCLRLVLSVTGSFKTSAYALFAKDARLRTSDVTALPVGILEKADYVEGVDGHQYATFEWKQKKTGRIANPAVGPEALNAVDLWMKYRTKKLGLSDSSTDPLFCTERTRKGYTTKNGVEVPGTRAGDWMKDSTMGVVFGQLVRKAGVEPDPLTGKLPSIHSLRKFHKTSLEYRGCPTSWVNKMQGRKGEGTGGRYTRINPMQLVEVYSQAYEGLEIYVAEPESEEVKQLQAQVDERAREIQELR